jgi:hypothetical protein
MFYLEFNVSPDSVQERALSSRAGLTILVPCGQLIGVAGSEYIVIFVGLDSLRHATPLTLVTEPCLYRLTLF